MITCPQNLLLFCKIFHIDHIPAGNKTCELNTELSMATVSIFIVAMVTIMLAFHLASSILLRLHVILLLLQLLQKSEGKE